MADDLREKLLAYERKLEDCVDGRGPNDAFFPDPTDTPLAGRRPCIRPSGVCCVPQVSITEVAARDRGCMTSATVGRAPAAQLV